MISFISGVISIGHPFLKQFVIKTDFRFLLGTAKSFLKVQVSCMLVSTVVCPHHTEEHEITIFSPCQMCFLYFSVSDFWPSDRGQI